MFADGVEFPLCEVEILFGVARGNAGMVEAVQAGMFVSRRVMFVPVVEKIVMQQGCADELSAVGAKMQAPVDLQGAAGDMQDVMINAHVAVLYEIFCPAEIGMIQDLCGVRAQERFHLFIFFISIHLLSSFRLFCYPFSAL